MGKNRTASFEESLQNLNSQDSGGSSYKKNFLMFLHKFKFWRQCKIIIWKKERTHALYKVQASLFKTRPGCTIICAFFFFQLCHLFIWTITFTSTFYRVVSISMFHYRCYSYAPRTRKKKKRINLTSQTDQRAHVTREANWPVLSTSASAENEKRV